MKGSQGLLTSRLMGAIWDFNAMATGRGRIEQIGLGRTVLRVAGWIDVPAVAGVISVRMAGIEADAEIYPSLSLVAKRCTFVAHVHGVSHTLAAGVEIVGPDGDTIVPNSETLVTRLRPIGYIDKALPELATGWLYDPDLMPGETAQIEIEGIGSIAFTPMIERQDVVSAGISPGPLVGFEVPLLPPPGYCATDVGDVHRQIRLLSRGIAVAVAETRLQRRLEGHITVTDRRVLSGWLRDLDGLPGPIIVDCALGQHGVLRIQTAANSGGRNIPDAAFAFERHIPTDKPGDAAGLARLLHPHDGTPIPATITVEGATFATTPGAAAAEAAISPAAGVLSRPRILSVIAATGGGTPQSNLDLMRGLERDFDPLILSAAPDHIRLDRVVGGVLVEIGIWWLADPISAGSHDSPAYRAVVTGLLERERVDIVHIRHLAWHGLSLIACARARQIPVVMSFHDYYTLCPNVKLLDERNRFCGGECTPGRGPCRPELWPVESLQPLKHERVKSWREMMNSVLGGVDHLITTSVGSQELIMRRLPALQQLPFDVIPHGRDFPTFGRAAAKLEPGERLKVLALGNISPAKGGHVIAALAADPRFEFHILGEAAAFLHTPAIIHHGSYARDNVIEQITSVAPHIGLIASIWPETHCHTLTELWAAGVPVVAFDFGAVGERLRRIGGGWLVEGTSALGIAKCLNSICDEPEMLQAVISKVHNLQEKYLSLDTTARMTDCYAEIYRALLKRAMIP